MSTDARSMSLGRWGLSGVLVVLVVLAAVSSGWSVAAGVVAAPARGLPAALVEHPATSSRDASARQRIRVGVRMAGQPTDWAERTYDVAMSEQSDAPEITPAMRASARANPDTWLYVIDPAFDADADVPPWGVVGAYPVDANGEITGTFRRNTAYRPSPAALRMPEPASDLERTLQLISAGHVARAELPSAVLRAPLLLYATSSRDRSVTGFPGPDGSVVVPACTSVACVPAAWPGWRQVTGRELAPLLNGYPLVINPAGPIAATVLADELTRASG